MYLIAKNKIADYIRQHPEAEVDFLVWLKQFPYREGKRSLADAEEWPAQWNITGESQLGNTQYTIRYRANLILKTAYIDWVGTADEFKGYMQEELKKQQALYPEKKIEHKVKITHVILTPPNPVALSEKRKAEALKPPPVERLTVQPVLTEEQIKALYLFKTTAEYESGLARAIEIFFAEPGTPERLELATLVPRLVYYEDKYIHLPELDPFDVVKLKMKEWGMGPQYPLDLINFIGSKEDLDQFLSDEKPLSKHALRILYNYLKIDFMDAV